MLHIKIKKIKKIKYKFFIFENRKFVNSLGSFQFVKNKVVLFINFFKLLFYINNGLNINFFFYNKNLKNLLIYFLNFYKK